MTYRTDSDVPSPYGWMQPVDYTEQHIQIYFIELQEEELENEQTSHKAS